MSFAHVRAVLLIAALFAAATASAAADSSPQVARLIAALNERDAKGFASSLDLEALSERVVDGLDLPAAQRAGVLTGMRRAGTNLAAGTIAVLERHNTRAVHLRSDSRNGARFVLIRYEHHDAEGESAGFDYVEFELGRDGRIVDWFSHAQGQAASVVMRMMLVAMMPDEGLFARLFGISNVDRDLVRIVGRMGELQRAGDFAGAHAILGEVQGSFRESQLWAVLRVTAAASAGGAIHTESLEHLSKHFGSEASLQFLLLDHYLTVGDFDTAIAAVERFEHNVIEDGITNQIKCASALQAEQWLRARRHCERGLEIEPAAEETWWLLITVGLHTRDAGLVLSRLEGFEQQFDKVFDPDLLVEDENYAWLKGLPEFKKWAARRRG